MHMNLRTFCCRGIAPTRRTKPLLLRSFSFHPETFKNMAAPQQQAWAPPAKVEELYPVLTGNKFTSINQPTAGARTEQELPKGEAPLQLYSLGTPNGIKVSILLEELGVDYDAWPISLGGDQFTSGFVGVNPNSKIPALRDYSDPDKVTKFPFFTFLLFLRFLSFKFLFVSFFSFFFCFFSLFSFSLSLVPLF